ncbi:MAG: 4a-hydroxytetrahydrobiopterin dehydratase [Bacillati bacterium ANGP1]|uniref:4a-hydroxytetrahydrobiopterin dehydratase n=1 Tax=Candidatus Segetimicrobium genomatis TaxID=2569760 RepID=A0A537L7B5_9BACT|nr:MAG: 4a-hydroxytetrahydrobiopterin dehydratase [Terrabacteria group bacterium ANGP1]
MAKLSENEIRTRLRDLPGWELTSEGIRKSVKCKDFKTAIALVNAVANLAEAANHHPDILIFGWNKVTFTLMTHSEKAVTDRDLAMAGQIEGAIQKFAAS